MKYQLNLTPKRIVVPVIELLPGQKGVIECVGIYPNETLFYVSVGAKLRFGEISFDEK